MPGQRYRLRTPTLAIFDQDGDKLPLTIPQGAEVRVVEPLNENPLLGVEWEGKPVLMFAVDLRERGELVEGNEA